MDEKPWQNNERKQKSENSYVSILYMYAAFFGCNAEVQILCSLCVLCDMYVAHHCCFLLFSLSTWNDFWSIDPITGVLSPVRPLIKRALGANKEVIHIQAKNRWSPNPASGSTADVSIHIRPVNRYPPQILINRPPQVS